MLIISGFIEVSEEELIPEIVAALKERNIEVHNIEAQRIVFLMERDSLLASGIEGRIRKELDSLKEIEGVSDVCLAYFCLDEDE